MNSFLDYYIEEALAELGNTPEEIATNLEKLSIKGIMGDSEYCILARFLREKFPKDNLRVSPLNIYSSYTRHYESLNIQLTEYQSEFVVNFDNGLYPTLAAGPEEIRRS